MHARLPNPRWMAASRRPGPVEHRALGPPPEERLVASHTADRQRAQVRRARTAVTAVTAERMLPARRAAVGQGPAARGAGPGTAGQRVGARGERGGADRLVWVVLAARAGAAAWSELRAAAAGRAVPAARAAVSRDRSARSRARSQTASRSSIPMASA